MNLTRIIIYWVKKSYAKHPSRGRKYKSAKHLSMTILTDLFFLIKIVRTFYDILWNTKVSELKSNFKCGRNTLILGNWTLRTPREIIFIISNIALSTRSWPENKTPSLNVLKQNCHFISILSCTWKPAEMTLPLRKVTTKQKYLR